MNEQRSADVNRIRSADGRVFFAEESCGGGCSDCDLLNTADCCDQACSSEERSDGRDMIFKEAKAGWARMDRLGANYE